MKPDALRVSAAEFILEGLYGHRRIARSEEREFSAGRSAKRDGGARRRKRGNRAGNTSEMDQLFALYR